MERVGKRSRPPSAKLRETIEGGFEKSLQDQNSKQLMYCNERSTIIVCMQIHAWFSIYAYNALHHACSRVFDCMYQSVTIKIFSARSLQMSQRTYCYNSDRLRLEILTHAKIWQMKFSTHTKLTPRLITSSNVFVALLIETHKYEQIMFNLCISHQEQWLYDVPQTGKRKLLK